jgi:hypothetical protein
MRRRGSWWRAVGVALVGLAATATPVRADPLKPTQRLGVGHSLLAGKEKAKPANGFITSQEDLAKLYEAWGLRVSDQEVDFSKEVVIVVTSTNRNIYDVGLDVDKGAATVKPDLRGEFNDKGYLFWIGTFPRKGLKSINGKALDGK